MDTKQQPNPIHCASTLAADDIPIGLPSGCNSASPLVLPCRETYAYLSQQRRLCDQAINADAGSGCHRHMT